MATYTTTAGVGGILPEQYGSLIVEPVQAASVAIRVSDFVSTDSVTFHVPKLTDDVSAQWVAEGDEIPQDDPAFDEDEVTPKKLAALTIISRELAEDTSPAAASLVGQSMARDMAKKVDLAFFGALVAPAPAGLGALTGYAAINAGTSWANVDPFTDALFAVEATGQTVDSWVANPADAQLISKIKTGSGSNQPLLGSDVTSPTKRTIQGVPLYVSPAVPVGTIWGIPRARSIVVMRSDVRLDTSRDAYFSSDRVAIRGTMRVAFSFPQSAALARISLSAAV
jgi:HK97 family phage major capsid protein